MAEPLAHPRDDDRSSRPGFGPMDSRFRGNDNVAAAPPRPVRLAPDRPPRQRGGDARCRTGAILAVASVAGIDDHLEAAKDHPLAVERHRVGLRIEARVGHHFFLHPVARFLRRPDHPREDHCFVGLALDRHGKRRHLAVRHVVAPAFHHLDISKNLHGSVVF